MIAVVPRVLYMSRRYVLLLLMGAVVSLHGCSTTPVSAPIPSTPSLTLLNSQPLVLPEDCESSGSVFVEFKVLNDGRTGDIRAPRAPDCVQRALTAWVNSFRYAPPAVETQTGIEWMMVTARSGS